MLVAAPPRFSTTTCWPQISDSLPATTRAMASVPPPGGNGTTRRTYRFGQPEVCARALLTRPSAEAAESAMKRRRLIMAFSRSIHRSRRAADCDYRGLSRARHILCVILAYVTWARTPHEVCDGSLVGRGVRALTQLLRRALLGDLDVGGFDDRTPLFHLILEVGAERLGRRA